MKKAAELRKSFNNNLTFLSQYQLPDGHRLPEYTKIELPEDMHYPRTYSGFLQKN